MSAILPAGAPIAVVAPSGVYDAERLARGVRIARDAGHVVVPFPDMLQPHRYLAARDDKRTADLTYALTNKQFAGVWVARGGYGLTRILGRIPWRAVRDVPVIGFSDATPLLDMIRRRGGKPPIHGPVLHSLPDTSPAARKHLFDLLAGRPTAPLSGTSWVGGAAEGPMYGGNLALLAATCGTPLADPPEGGILLLEDVGEAPYRIDRMLQQLKLAGQLDRVAGVAVGRFHACDPPGDAGWALEDVLREHLEPLGVPVVGDLPVGHVRDNFAVPLGTRGRLADGQLSWAPPTA